MKTIISNLILPVILVSTAYCLTVTHTDYTDGDQITAEKQNQNENAAVSVLNGYLDSSNFTAGGLTNSLLTDSTLSGGLIGNNTLTTVNFSSPAVSGSVTNSTNTASGQIRSASLATQDFVALAVSSSVVTNSSGTTSVLSADLLASSITTLGGPVVIFYHGINTLSTDTLTCSLNVTRNTVSIPGCKTDFQGAVSGSFIADRNTVLFCLDNPPAGTYIYRVTTSCGGGNPATYNFDHFITIELRK